MGQWEWKWISGMIIRSCLSYVEWRGRRQSMRCLLSFQNGVFNHCSSDRTRQTHVYYCTFSTRESDDFAHKLDKWAQTAKVKAVNLLFRRFLCQTWWIHVAGTRALMLHVSKLHICPFAALRVRELPCQHWLHSGSNCFRQTKEKNNFNVYSVTCKWAISLVYIRSEAISGNSGHVGYHLWAKTLVELKKSITCNDTTTVPSVGYNSENICLAAETNVASVHTVLGTSYVYKWPDRLWTAHVNAYYCMCSINTFYF